MYMKIHLFRKDLKKYFDKAMVEPVFIERAGMVYKLESYGPISSGMRELVFDKRAMKATPKGIELAGEVAERVHSCKNGHLANPAGKCLQKGCKFA